MSTQGGFRVEVSLKIPNLKYQHLSISLKNTIDRVVAISASYAFLFSSLSCLVCLKNLESILYSYFFKIKEKVEKERGGPSKSILILSLFERWIKSSLWESFRPCDTGSICSGAFRAILGPSPHRQDRPRLRKNGPARRPISRKPTRASTPFPETPAFPSTFCTHRGVSRTLNSCDAGLVSQSKTRTTHLLTWKKMIEAANERVDLR